MRNLLLVLIVRDAGLRSTLAARLSLTGADLVTAEDFHDPVIGRSVRRPATLVVDRATMERQVEGWVDGLLGQPLWRRVVVLTDRRDHAEPANDRLVLIDRAGAAAGLIELLPRWAAEHQA